MRSLLQIFAAPSLLALATGIGLLSALLGDGVWDVVSWLAIALPIGAIMRCVYRRGT
jgi:hypothetical protein